VPALDVAWGESWLWLGGSLLLAILWANLAWFFRKPRFDPIDGFIDRLVSWPLSSWLLQALRLLYYLGMPFAALLWGHNAVVERVLGLKRLDLSIADGNAVSADVAANWLEWAHDVGWAAALSFGTWVVLALGWRACRRALNATGKESAVARASSSGWVLLREAAYHEVHWAFYRNAPILTAGTYWGTWIGLGLAMLEAALNPAWRNDLSDAQRASGTLMRGALGVFSTLLYLETQNLWLALVAHWGVCWGLVSLARMLPLPPTGETDQIAA
jgi:hypothetical protein